MAKSFTESARRKPHLQNDADKPGLEGGVRSEQQTEETVKRLEEAIRQARIARVSGAKLLGKVAEHIANKALGRLFNDAPKDK